MDTLSVALSWISACSLKTLLSGWFQQAFTESSGFRLISSQRIGSYWQTDSSHFAETTPKASALMQLMPD